VNNNSNIIKEKNYIIVNNKTKKLRIHFCKNKKHRENGKNKKKTKKEFDKENLLTNDKSNWIEIENHKTYDNYLHLDEIKFPPKTLPQDELINLDPYELFQLFFTDELFLMLMENSNKNLESFKYNSTLYMCEKWCSSHHPSKMKPITLEEIKVFIGTRLLFCLNKYKNYQGKYTY